MGDRPTDELTDWPGSHWERHLAVAAGSALRNMRQRADLTLEEMADKIGRYKSSISRVENGLARFPSHTTQLMAEEMGWSLGDLLVQTACYLPQRQLWTHVARALSEEVDRG